MSRCPKRINEQLVDRLDQALAIDPDLHLVPAPHPVSTIHEDEAPTDISQELRPDRLQKEGPGARSLSGTALPQDLVERIGCHEL